MRGILRSVVAAIVATSAWFTTTAATSHPAKAAMPWKKQLIAAIAAMLAVSACTSTEQHHVGLTVTKGAKFLFGDNPYKINYEACIVSETPYPGKDKVDDVIYIINFPNTVKSLEWVNVYESPRDLYKSLEAFPDVPKECLPSPDVIPTAYPSYVPSGPLPTQPPVPTPTPTPPTQTQTQPTQPPTPPPTTPPVSSAQCTLGPYEQYCLSSDPTVIVDVGNYGDDVGCTFNYTVTWNDGSPPQTVQIQGQDGGLQYLATHTYAQPGAYAVQIDGSVVSGNCTTDSGNYTFAYVTGGGSAG